MDEAGNLGALISRDVNGASDPPSPRDAGNGAMAGIGWQTGSVPCPTCSGSQEAGSGPNVAPSYVYAIGRIETRFPSPSVEKEFAQATARADTAGKTDQQALHALLSERENRYLVRQLCWVMSIQGLETYILHPRDPADFDLLVSAVRPTPSPLDVNVVIGLRGPIALPGHCNGLLVPIVAFDQIYSFDREALIKAIPKPHGVTVEHFGSTAEEVFDRIVQMADNAGATDEHRALNYLTMRYPAIYATTADEFTRDFSLTSVEARPSSLSGTRKIVEVIFSYTNRNTDFAERFFVRVDVTDEFPYLITKLAPYYSR